MSTDSDGVSTSAAFARTSAALIVHRPASLRSRWSEAPATPADDFVDERFRIR
jgi:hypothetical protein